MLRQRTKLAVLVAGAGLGMLLTGVTAAQQTSSTPSESVKPAAAPGPPNNVRPAIKWNRSDYTCEGGAKIAVYLLATVSKVPTQDTTYILPHPPPPTANPPSHH